MAIAVESAVQGRQIIWGAPVYDQVMTGWVETKKALGELITAKVIDTNQSRMEMVFPGGGGIMYRSLDNPDNARSKTADGVVIDEAGYAAQEAWHEVLRPMLMDTGGWAWLIGTPDGLNWFYDGFEEAGSREDSAAWQAPTLGVKIVNGQLVRSPHPLENPNISFQEMLSLWQTMPEDTFKQEILAEFIADSGAVFRFINEAAIAKTQEQAQHSHIYILGVDPAQRKDFTVVQAIDATIGEQCFMDRFNQLEYSFQIDRIKAICERFRPEMVVFEETGNLALIEALYGTQYYDKVLGKSVDIPVWAFKTTNASKVKVIQDLALAFERRSIRILNDRTLKNELLAFTKDKTDSGLIKYGAPEGKHDDCVMSLAFAWSQAKEYLSEDTLNARERAGIKTEKLMPVKERPADGLAAESWDKTKEIRQGVFEEEEKKSERSWLQQIEGFFDD